MAAQHAATPSREQTEGDHGHCAPSPALRTGTARWSREAARPLSSEAGPGPDRYANAGGVVLAGGHDEGGWRWPAS